MLRRYRPSPHPFTWLENPVPSKRRKTTKSSLLNAYSRGSGATTLPLPHNLHSLSACQMNVALGGYCKNHHNYRQLGILFLLLFIIYCASGNITHPVISNATMVPSCGPHAQISSWWEMWGSGKAAVNCNQQGKRGHYACARTQARAHPSKS